MANENQVQNHNNTEGNVEFIIDDQFERPTKFSPDWPPKTKPTPLPSLYNRCAKTFKKVQWPPAGYEEEPEIEPPPAPVLLDQIPLNDTAMKINKAYKLLPGVYVEEPAELPEDVWPPPEPINTDERTIHDPTRKKRVIRDYTVFFDKNKADVKPSYRVPPGTLHVYSDRGVLEFDTPELGSGRPKDSAPI